MVWILMRNHVEVYPVGMEGGQNLISGVPVSPLARCRFPRHRSQASASNGTGTACPEAVGNPPPLGKASMGSDLPSLSTFRAPPGRWIIDSGNGNRIIWLMPEGTPAPHVLRLLRAGLGVIRLSGLDASLEGTLMGAWPGEAMLPPFSDEAGGRVRAEGLHEALAGEGVPEPAAGAPLALVSPREEDSFGRSREILLAAAEGGLAVLSQAGMDSPDRIDTVFIHAGPVGVFVAQAPPGCHAEEPKEVCLGFLKMMIEAEPGIFSLWPSGPASGALDTLGSIPEDGATGPAAIAFCRIADGERADFALDSVLAARQGRLAPPPETPS